MGTEFSFEELQALLASLGISLPKELFAVLLLLAIARFFNLFEIMAKIIRVVWEKIKELAHIWYNQQEKDFVNVRNRFVTHLIYEVERLNQEADWNDFTYTQLEAEVEVDRLADLNSGRMRKFMARFWTGLSLLKELFQRTSTVQKKDSLVEAITDSHSRAFLVIGDPGSGKTVSLRHLFLKLADGCKNSRNKNTVVPLYLNLKGLNIPADEITGDTVRQWVLAQLQAGQDRLIYKFLDKHFDSMLDNGRLFFMFDSFDEIPAVMDAQEDTEIVGQYALALNRFLHAPHQCRGLVSSRPYRAPKIFMGQRMTIRALPDKRIRSALDRYLFDERQLSQQLWQELISQRSDLLHVCRNPFYLSLMARYVSENKSLPDRQYDLFEHFIQSRVRTDEKRLHTFGLDPKTTIKQTSQLAFAMTKAPHIGLEANEAQILGILTEQYPDEGWEIPQIKQLLGALTYSKIGRRIQESGGRDSTIFSFVHRRFHEYFSARHLRELPDDMPAQDLLTDNRWREVLVLLCEVLPIEQLGRIFEVATHALEHGVQAETGTPAHRRAIEALRFLRDGFHSRIADLPVEISQLSTKFIQKQLTEGNLLDQKRSMESLAIADQDNMASLLEQALNSESVWLRDIAFRSCRIPNSLNLKVVASLRQYLYSQYISFHLHRNHETYRTLLSGSPPLMFVKRYAEMLLGLTGLQLIIIFSQLFLILRINFAAFLFATSLTLLIIYLYMTKPPQSKHPHIRTKSNPFVVMMLMLLLMMSTVLTSTVNNENNDSLSLPLSLFLFLIQWMLAFSVVVWINYPDTGVFIWLKDIVKQFNIFTFIRERFYSILTSILLILLLLAMGKWGLPSVVMQFIVWITSFALFKMVVIVISGLTVLLVLIAVIVVGVVYMQEAFQLLYDQRQLTSLLMQPNTRPKGARRAVSLMSTFKTEPGKRRYVQKLFQWLSPNQEWSVLIEAAKKEKGYVRDLLYQLAEIWEDSAPK